MFEYSTLTKYKAPLLEEEASKNVQFSVISFKN